MDKIKLIIVDDHEIVRNGLRGYLELLEDFEILGEGRNGIEAVELALKFVPDIVLMDLIMPEMDGIEATRRIIAGNPDIRIIILSSFSDDEHVLPAIQAGAKGYILKDISPDELADTLREAYKGNIKLQPSIAEKLMQQFQQKEKTGQGPAATVPEVDTLTDRELEVLRCIGQGKSNKEIADALSISPLTVKTHVSNILGKLALYDRTQAAIFALKKGIVAQE